MQTIIKKIPNCERSSVSVYGFPILDIKSMFSTGVTHESSHVVLNNALNFCVLSLISITDCLIWRLRL